MEVEARILIALLLVPCAACAPAPPPAPPPVIVEAAPDEPAREPSPSRHDPLDDLDPVATVPPPAPWIPPAVTWEPHVLREGTALAFQLRQPAAGREPLSVEADLAGVSVHLTRTATGWFGLGALPIESAGRRTVSFRFGVTPDSVEERRFELEVAPVEWPSTRLRIPSRTLDPTPETRARLEAERRRIRGTIEHVTLEWLADGGFDWPRRGRITSPFGERRLFKGKVQSLHLGLDVAGATGAPVRAAGTGRVALKGHFFLQGNAVYLDHGLGVYSGYFHLSSSDVVEGQWIERGQLLGRVGATGRVTGPHLHWSLYVSGHSLDPRSLLEIQLDEWEAGPAGDEPEARRP